MLNASIKIKSFNLDGWLYWFQLYGRSAAVYFRVAEK
jgi:hypothetical protein